MSVAAIICEYNPFHNGHKYQIDSIKKELNPDYIICLMSGDYVERGEPAIFSKELRTKWALENGVSAVIELPIPYATASADLFAFGAISFLNKLNCVDYLVFGSESGDINELSECCDKLETSGSINSFEIQKLMREGNTFAKARALLFPSYEKLLSTSNNVLALEYLSSLKKTNSTIKPYTIKREGQAYEDSVLLETSYLSASSIRNALKTGQTEKIAGHVPFDFSNISEKPVFADDMSGELLYSILTNIKKIDYYLESGTDLAKRIENQLNEYKSFTQFIEVLKSKNYTYSRLSRTLLHIMLGIEGSIAFYRENLNDITHLKLLGFRKDDSALLKLISEKAKIHVVSGFSSVYDELNIATREMVDTENFAGRLRGRIIGDAGHEFSKKIVIV